MDAGEGHLVPGHKDAANRAIEHERRRTSCNDTQGLCKSCANGNILEWKTVPFEREQVLSIAYHVLSIWNFMNVLFPPPPILTSNH